MTLMLPIYYILAVLFFGLVGGFCVRCYQYSNGDFFRVLTCSAKEFIKMSFATSLSPLLVALSEDFRRRLLEVLVSDAADDYNEAQQDAVNLNDDERASLINVLLNTTSRFDFVRVAANMSRFYFFNSDAFANAIMQKVAETSQAQQPTDLNVRDISFYQNSVLARTLFCL